MKPTTLLTLATAVVAQGNFGQIATLCGQYSGYSAAQYNFNNNLWGESSGSGEQCTYIFKADSTGVAWTSTWTWNGGQGLVKSYAYSGLDVPKGRLIGSITSMPTSVNWTYSDTNINVDIAYDLFTASDPNHSTSSGDYELMIWLGKYGTNRPIGSIISTVQIDGITWDVWYGSVLPGQKTYSFVARSIHKVWSGDIKRFFNWLTNNRGYPAGSQYLLTNQFGSEPQTGGQTTISVSHWSASIN